MNENSNEDIKALIKNCLILFNKYQKSMDESNQARLQHEAALNKTLTHVEKEISKIITSTTDKKFDDLEKRIKYLCDWVNDSTAKMNKASSTITKQTKVSGWTSIGGVLLAAIAIIGFTAWYEFRKLADLKQIDQNIAYQTEYYKKIELTAEIKNAISKVNITSCGGNPCLNLDTQAKRWGEEGDYILIKDEQ